MDSSDAIITLNRAAEEMFGYSREELLGQSVDLLVPEAMRAAHVQRRESYTHDHPQIRPMGVGMELSARQKDGTMLPVEISLSPNQSGNDLTVVAIVRNMTTHRRMQEAVRKSEERLSQAQKLEALGRLSGGIAHEFNNMLTMVLGYAELLQASLSGDAVLSGYVEKTRNAARRASNLTRQLLAFGRRQVLEPQAMDLNSAVVDTCQALARTMEDIEIITLPSMEPARVNADRGQIEQMLFNLASNAREAMQPGGRLTFAVSIVNVGQGGMPSHPELMDGRYVLLAVSDTGEGMKPEVKARIFEPFFSTRDFGKGQGLGLAAVYGIVNQSGGGIAVSSEPQSGTTFSIFLPWIAGEDASGVSTVSTPALRGSETILLVDDQPQLLAMMRTFLEKMGYAVMTAALPTQALQIAGGFQGEIHVLLTDVMMPEMNGLELAHKLREARPAVKVLYVSGYTDQNLDNLPGVDPAAAFLEKPFALEDLALKLRNLCGAAGNGDGEKRPATN